MRPAILPNKIMASDRLRGYLFIIISFTVFWFIIVLFCLPDSENQNERWPSDLDGHESGRSSDSVSHSDNSNSRFQVPYSPNHHIRHILAAIPKLSLKQTLIYDFDPNLSNETQYNTSLNKSQHEKETLLSTKITRTLDELVKLDGDKLFAFNLLVSNRVGALRALPDTRHSECPRVESLNLDPSSGSPPWTTDLKASIIICYYNEAPSALLRTVNSIVHRSPAILLEELIIIDDFSAPFYGVDLIRQHLETLSSRVKIRITRTTRREGLIRARLFGASLARGDVLIFLDSHVEANLGWLEPLMSTIAENGTTIACPMTDLINAETMIYSACPMVKGGLNWALNFKWDSVPAYKLKKTEDFIRPIESPTMAGGLYAIKRDYFYHLGAYDRSMDLWGGENIEMSLRVWLCGGRIVILPCSRIGHIFRKTRPYGPEPNQPDSLLINSHRTARVWLDEYIENYYNHYPHARVLVDDDISERQQLRLNLKCNNFSWFLNNIYPELKGKEDTKPEEVSMRSTKLVGASSRRINRSADGINKRKIRRRISYESNINFERYKESFHPSLMQQQRQQQLPEPEINHKFQMQLSKSNLCLGARKGFIAGGFRRIALHVCSPMSGEHHHKSSRLDLKNQLWTWSENNELRLGHDQCLDLYKNLPMLRSCHNMGSTQAWKKPHDTPSATHIYNLERGLCLAAERIQIGEPVVVTLCDTIIDQRGIKTFPGPQLFGPQTASWMTGSMLSDFGNSRSGSSKSLEPNQRWTLLVFQDNALYNTSDSN